MTEASADPWFSHSEYTATVHPSDPVEDIDKRCIICFESLDQQSCIVLNCAHKYHLGCWLKVVDKKKCCLCTLPTDTSAAQVNAGITVHARESFTSQVNPELTFHAVNLPLLNSLFPFNNVPYVPSMGLWGTHTEATLPFDEENKRTDNEEDVEERSIQFHERGTHIRKILKMMKQLKIKINVQRRQNVALLSMIQSEMLKLVD